MNKKTILFVVAVLVQVLILAAVPARNINARLTGKLITIKTAPVDPYDFLSGYHVILNYEISTPNGGDTFREGIKGSAIVYVILKEGTDGIWNAETEHETKPKDIPQDCIIIKGLRTYRGIKYGIESYFIPEKGRQKIEADLRENARQANAQIKVDKSGNAVLIRLIVGENIYEY